MKIISILIALITLSWLNAEEASSAPNPDLPIRVELDVIELPHDTLRKLTRGKTIESLHSTVLNLIKEKNAKRINTSLCTVKSGEKCSIESVREVIYPTEYEPPGHTCGGRTLENGQGYRERLTSTAFETRNVGEVISVSPTIKKNGTTINLYAYYHMSTVVKFTTFFNYTDQWGKSDVTMPEFSSTEINHSVNLENGKPTLYSTYTPLNKEGKPDSTRKVLVFIKATIIDL